MKMCKQGIPTSLQPAIDHFNEFKRRIEKLKKEKQKLHDEIYSLEHKVKRLEEERNLISFTRTLDDEIAFKDLLKQHIKKNPHLKPLLNEKDWL